MNKLLEVAITQIGVQEDAHHLNLGESKKYQDAVGLPHKQGFPWCQSLIFYCGLVAYGAELNPVPKTGGVLVCLKLCKEKGYKYISRIDILANCVDIKPGTQFFIKHDEVHGHTGVIEFTEVNEKGHFILHTIEGNTNDKGERDGYECCRRMRNLNLEENIIGFIEYPEPDSQLA